MSSIGERLKLFRKSLQLAQNQVSTQLGLLQGSYSDIERNKTKGSISVYEKLDEVYNLNINWLLTGRGSMFMEVDTEVGKSNVIVSNLAANASPGITSQYVELSSRAYLPMVRNGAVAFPIQGKSMIPVFDDGDWLLCYELERVEDVKSGSIYVIRTNEGVLLCKYIIKKGVKWELLSENSANFGVVPIEVEDINKVFKIEKVITSRYGWEN